MADFDDPLGAAAMLAAESSSSLRSSSLLSSPHPTSELSSPITHITGASTLPATSFSAKTPTAGVHAPPQQTAGTMLSSAEVFIDPLSGAALSSPVPLPSAASSSYSHTYVTNTRPCPYLDWQARKSQILKEYTVTGKIAVSASFMSDNPDDAGDEVEMPLAKARQRLEALEAAARGVATVEMSQAEYIKRIEKLHRALNSAWENNHRVTALKISIQCAKMLGEHRVPQFYPSMFVMVTDILDSFGRLVFERLKSLADEEYKRLGNKDNLPGRVLAIVTVTIIAAADNFIAADVGGEARETCKNWMYKTACIRELLPRLYVEMALLECYRFIYDADFAAILLRLAQSIRGIGNPIVAAYARLYLARMAAKLVRDDNRQRESTFLCVSDFLVTFNDVAHGAVPTALEAQGVSTSVYLHLFYPSLAWQFHQLGWGANRDVFVACLRLYKERCNNSMVLQLLFEAFDPYFYAQVTGEMVSLIKAAKPSMISSAELYRTLATRLVKSLPPPDACKDFLLSAYDVIPAVRDVTLFCKHAVGLMEFIIAAFGEPEIVILLQDVARRVSAAGDDLPASALPHLETLLTNLVQHEVSRNQQGTKFSGGVLASSHFTVLLDVFDGEHKPRLCKSLLNALSVVDAPMTDAIVVNTMLEVARACHDSLDVLSSDDERRTMSVLICSFVKKIDLGRDLERQLELYVDCRQSFPNLDPVKDTLVTCAIQLTWKALKFTKGKHNAKTLNFVKSVLAYVAITIPDIDDPFRRMALYQAAGQAALHNNCVAQGDMLFRGVVQEIPDLHTSLSVFNSLAAAGARANVTGTATDLRLLEFLKEFTKDIIPAPGHPEQGPFYLARGLLNAIQKYTWQSGAFSAQRLKAVLLLIPYARAMANDPLPIVIPNLDSNDVLYAGDPDYPVQLVSFLRAVIETLVTSLEEISVAVAGGDTKLKAVQLDVLPEILSHHTTILEVDPGAIPALQVICKHLHDIAPEHPQLKAAVSTIKQRIAS